MCEKKLFVDLACLLSKVHWVVLLAEITARSPGFNHQFDFVKHHTIDLHLNSSTSAFNGVVMLNLDPAVLSMFQDDRDVDFTLNCSGFALLNITFKASKCIGYMLFNNLCSGSLW
jgi:hypothetical protein